MTLEELMDRFGMAKPTDRGFMVPCPAHDDRNPSLHITENEKGIGLYCHAGCETEDILAALDIGWSDLTRTPPTPSQEPVAIYSYTDENGKELYQRLRFHPKKFSQRHRVGDAWVWNMHGVKPTLYKLPTLAFATGRTVYITEGEKDVDRLVAEGVLATTSGGVNSWKPEFGWHLTQARKVIVIADRDTPGIKHAEHVADCLRDAGIKTEVVKSLIGKDVSDHLDAGHTLDDLVAYDQPVRHYQPMNLFAPVPPVDWVVENIVVGGEATLLIGDGGSGKSYFALAMALQVAIGAPFLHNKTKQGKVMYVDEEGSPDLALQRLEQLSATDAQKRNIDYLNFTKVDLVREPEKLLEDIRLVKPVLVVIDSHAKVTRMGEENSNNEMGRVWDDGFLPLARDTGAAVLVIHHTNGFGGARGASQIRNSADQVLKMKINDDDTRTIWPEKQRRMMKALRFEFVDKGFGKYEIIEPLTPEEWR